MIEMNTTNTKYMYLFQAYGNMSLVMQFLYSLLYSIILVNGLNNSKYKISISFGYIRLI